MIVACTTGNPPRIDRVEAILFVVAAVSGFGSFIFVGHTALDERPIVVRE